MDREVVQDLRQLLASTGVECFPRLSQLRLLQADTLLPFNDQDGLRLTLADTIKRTPSLSDVALGSGWQSQGVLQALSCLPALLELDLPGWTMHSMRVAATRPPTDRSIPFFPTLRSLRVNEDTIRLFLPSLTAQLIGEQVSTRLPSTAYVQPIQHIRLSYELDLETSDYGLQPSGQYTASIHSIGHYHKSLQNLSIDLTGFVFVIPFLHPITSCTQLRHLEVEGFNSGEYDLEPLIKHLPLLETLRWE